MAHSFITFKDRSEMMKDRDVFVVIGLLRAHLESGQTDARNILDGWFFGYDEMPSGAIDLRLNEVLHNTEVRQEISSSAKSALKTLIAFGENVPGEWLTEVLNDGDNIAWNDRPTKDVLALVERFLTVIE